MKHTASTESVAPAEIASLFFSHYNKQDVPAMVALFEEAGNVEYVPFDLSGPVEEIGPNSWGVLIDAFPNLSNEVRSIREGGKFAFVDVDIRGTQSKEAFGVPNRGKSYDVRHLFVFEINSSGKIVSVTCFWDNASWYRQLGKSDLSE